MSAWERSLMWCTPAALFLAFGCFEAAAVSNDVAHSFRSARESLFIVQTDTSAATAFLVEMDGNRWLLTNTHVLRGARSISVKDSEGKGIRLGQLEVSSDRDLARFMVKDISHPALLLDTDAPLIGEPVFVCGNSEGRGVLTALKGQVNGVGPTEIEVDAGFVSGNSGSPILNGEGRVIAVATYVKVTDPDGLDPSVVGTRFSGTRRFGVRVADRMQWVRTSLTSARAEFNCIVDTQAFLRNVDILLDKSWYKSALKGSPVRIQPKSMRAETVKQREAELIISKRLWQENWDRAERAKAQFLADTQALVAPESYHNEYWAIQLSSLRAAMADLIVARHRYIETSDFVDSEKAKVIRIAHTVSLYARHQLTSVNWTVPCYREEAAMLADVVDRWVGERIPRK